MAVGRPPSAPAIETYTIPGRLFQDDRADERLPFGSRGGAVIDHHFPADGDYTVTIRLQKTLYNAVRGLADPHQLELRVNRARVHTFTVGGAEVKPPPASFAGTLTWNPEWEQYANHADAQLTVTVPVKAGTQAVGVAFVRRAWEPEDVVQPPRTGWGFGTDEMYDANPRGRERDDRRALQADRRERHAEPPAHFHLPARKTGVGRVKRARGRS